MKIDLDERELTFIRNALGAYSMHLLQHGRELKQEEDAKGEDSVMSDIVFSEHAELGKIRTKVDQAREKSKE